MLYAKITDDYIKDRVIEVLKQLDCLRREHRCGTESDRSRFYEKSAAVIGMADDLDWQMRVNYIKALGA